MVGANRRTSTMIHTTRNSRQTDISGLRPVNNSKHELAKKLTEQTFGSARRKKAVTHDQSFDRLLRE